MSLHADRRDRLRKRLKQDSLAALLVTNVKNVTYLTGFSGDDSYLLLTPKTQVIISDFRFEEQLAQECPGLEVHIRRTGAGRSIVDSVAEVCASAGVKQLGVEAQSLSLATFQAFQAKLSEIALATTSGLIEELRKIKDKEELALIRQAVRCAEKAFGVLRASLRPDLTERQAAHDLEHTMRSLGARGCAFPPIVAVGARASLPHAVPTEVKLGESPLLLVDWGADVGGYKSDLTRVLLTGKIPPKLERAYRVVAKSQELAIAAIRPGASTHEIDHLARNHIEQAGFGRYFGHGLGHGFGLDIHEWPRLSVGGQETLRAGMVVTVEPGIYLPGLGGIRIEDDVLVTRGGHEVLTSLPKSFEEALVG